MSSPGIQVIYKSYEELFTSDNSVSIHQRNIQKLALELFKVLNKSVPEIMYDVFTENNSNNYERHTQTLVSRTVRTVHYGTDSIVFLALKIWKIVPSNMKESKSINEFKLEIKKWVPK